MYTFDQGTMTDNNEFLSDLYAQSFNNAILQNWNNAWL